MPEKCWILKSFLKNFQFTHFFRLTYYHWAVYISYRFFHRYELIEKIKLASIEKQNHHEQFLHSFRKIKKLTDGLSMSKSKGNIINQFIPNN